MKVFSGVVGLLAFFCAVNAAAVDYANVELSDYMELCDRADPGRDQCFKKSFQDAVNNYHKGFEPLGISTFDPMIFKNLRFNFESPIVLLSSLVIKNARVVGFSKAKINAVRTQFTENEMSAVIDVEMPRIFIEGVYKGQGRYTNLRYGPQGYFNLTAADLSMSIKLGGRTEVRNNETYMKLNKFDMKPEIGKMKTNIEGLFPDPELTRIAVELINQNWQSMYKVMVDEAKGIWEPLFLDQANGIFNVIPYRKMFA